MAKTLKNRITFVWRAVSTHPITQTIFAIWFVSGVYDLLRSEFIPEFLGLPPIYGVAAMILGITSYQLWIMAGIVIIALACVEHGYRKSTVETGQKRRSFGPGILIVVTLGASAIYFWRDRVYSSHPEPSSRAAVPSSQKAAISGSAPPADDQKNIIASAKLLYDGMTFQVLHADNISISVAPDTSIIALAGSLIIRCSIAKQTQSYHVSVTSEQNVLSINPFFNVQDQMDDYFTIEFSPLLGLPSANNQVYDLTVRYGPF